MTRFLSSLVLLISLTVHATVVTYPDPGLAAAGTEAQQSTFWRVDVVQGGATNNSFAYWIPSTKPDTNPRTNATFTTYSASGSHTVQVTKLYSGSVSAAKVYPTSYGISASVSGGTNISFTVPDPGTGKKMTVICDDDWSHPLCVFADPLETSVPTQGTPGVVWFGAPGVYDLGTYCFGCANGQTIYIQGGAYVKGQIHAYGRTNLTIRGRGILSGEDFTHQGASFNSMIRAHTGNARNLLIEGITIIQPPDYLIRDWQNNSNTIVRNVKGFGWNYNSDFVHIGRYGLVEDSFCWVNDDAFVLMMPDVTLRRNVIAMLDNGAPFSLGWQGIPQGATNIYVSDSDVIRTDWIGTSGNKAVIAALRSGSGGDNTDVHFQDIRAENCNGRALWIEIQDTLASLHGVTFTNFFMTNSAFTLNATIKGFDSTHLISDFTFHNFWMNGTNVVGSATNLITQINTSNIVFTP